VICTCDLICDLPITAIQANAIKQIENKYYKLQAWGVEPLLQCHTANPF